jgi:hypothetical protein
MGVHRYIWQPWGGGGDVVRQLAETWPEGKEALNEAGQTPLSIGT